MDKKTASETKAPDPQTDVITFLGSATSYPGEVSEVKRAETHAAIVFLAGDRAYKLKRAVRLPYLDFTSIEKRHHTLMRELQINSQISPELYLEVLPINRAANSGKLSLGGPGEAVDWVLMMRRFDEQASFDRIADKGPLRPEHVEEIARVVEHLHMQAAAFDTGSWVRKLSAICDDLESTLTGSEIRSANKDFSSYIASLRQELACHRNLLEVRERAGFVRRCHGDLHLGNLVLWNGKPTPFDAIEFDDELATIDVLYDLAFLLMDLWHRGRKREANAIFNHSMQPAAISEIEGLRLLPLYLSIRAAIRAMTGVHGLVFKRGEARDRAIQEIEGYGRLAHSFLEHAPISLVAIGGLSGTGKTTIARAIAPFIGAAPGALHLRTDVERKLMHGVGLNQPLASSVYTPENSALVYHRIFKKAEISLDGGHSVVADAVFPNEFTRDEARDVAQRVNAAFSPVWLEAPEAVIDKRVSERCGDASDADVEVVAQQLRTILPPEHWIRLDASKEASETARTILNLIGASSEEQPETA